MKSYIYLVLLFALGAMLAHLGAPVDTLQYWVVMSIVMGIFFCGRTA